jgi:outer membrane receptor protein involved in Fe transport
LRFRGAASWRRAGDAVADRAVVPPEFDGRLQVLWENHFFREDGILQLGYQLAHRGAVNDPWSFDTPTALPAFTQHDAIVGFRLVGADLSLMIRNATDKRQTLSAGAVSYGRELFWRLRWVFYR